MEILKFNTGRTYTEHGQRVAAIKINDGVFFSDMDRGIASFLPGCPLEQSEIMRRYDYNENMEWSLPTDGKNPESRWELIEKLDASHSAPTPAAATPAQCCGKAKVDHELPSGAVIKVCAVTLERRRQTGDR